MLSGLQLALVRFCAQHIAAASRANLEVWYFNDGVVRERPATFTGWGKLALQQVRKWVEAGGSPWTGPDDIRGWGFVRIDF